MGVKTYLSTSTDDALQTRYIGYIPRRHRHANIPKSFEHYVRMTETVPPGGGARSNSEGRW